MSQSQNQPPKFSFGGSSGGSNIFGSTPSSSAPAFGASFGSTAPASSTPGGLFGSSTPASSATGGNTLGAGTTAGNASGGNIFGSQSTNSGGNPFGSTLSGANTSGSGFSFGATPATSAQPGASGGTSTAGSTFTGFNLGGTATSSASPAGASGPSLFATPATPAKTPAGGQQPASSNLFGNTAFSAPTSSQAGSTTPAQSKPFNFANPSTTPAGAPPSSSAGAGSSFLAGSGKPQEQKSNLFGTGASQASGQAQPQASTAPTPSLFGNMSNQPAASSGQLFNFNKAGQSSTAAPASQSTLSSASTGAKPPLFVPLGQTSTPPQGQAQPPKSTTNLFSGLGGTSNTSTPASQSTPSLFGGGTASSSQAPSTANATSQPTPSLFGPTSSTPTAPKPLASTSTTPSLFAPAAASTSATPSTTATSNATKTSLFQPAGGQSKPGETPATSTPSSSAPATSTLFGGKQSAPEQASGAGASSQAPAQTTGAATSAPNNTNLAASTSGPKPTPQSRLKNKSMDEIITRWATDLSKYQKDFQGQATKVAQWDRVLVENSDKIQKLYGSTLEAERATIEVERQLAAVENDQNELEYWLDHYEKQVDEMTATQIGSGDSLTGPDQERERTYKLAEKLSDRLDEMGRDLTGMVEEINDASSHLNKNSKPDDPLSQIVRVLNGHLSQLQQIDQGTASLKAKVSAAQKASRNFGNGNGSSIGSDATDDFYRSYMQGR